MDSRTASIHPACFHVALKLGISKVFVKLKKLTQQKFLLQAQHCFAIVHFSDISPFGKKNKKQTNNKKKQQNFCRHGPN